MDVGLSLTVPLDRQPRLGPSHGLSPTPAQREASPGAQAEAPGVSGFLPDHKSPVKSSTSHDTSSRLNVIVTTVFNSFRLPFPSMASREVPASDSLCEEYLQQPRPSSEAPAGPCVADRDGPGRGRPRSGCLLCSSPQLPARTCLAAL